MQVLDDGWQKLFKMYFDREMSLSFINCADKQISKILETNLPGSVQYTRLRWDPAKALIYIKGLVSILKTEFSFNYGHLIVDIRWHSRSNRIYDIADTDIDCPDIVFELEGLDVAKMNHLIKPKWSLFTFPESTIDSLLQLNKQRTSVAFIKCADVQLSGQFEARTCIKINRNISITFPLGEERFRYEKDKISKLSVLLYVNHNWNEMFILWKSKSGKIYDIADDDIPCEDIEFSFDNSFDALLYHKQLYPKVALPFNLKNLPFEVTIERLNIDCVITMTLKDDAASKAEEAVQKIDTCINDFNTKAEKDDEDAVHNWRTEVEDNRIIYQMDTGFAGPEILKTLFKLFAKMNIFSKVTVQ